MNQVKQEKNSSSQAELSPRPALLTFEVTCDSHSHPHRVMAESEDEARRIANAIYGQAQPVKTVQRIGAGGGDNAR